MHGRKTYTEREGVRALASEEEGERERERERGSEHVKNYLISRKNKPKRQVGLNFVPQVLS